MVRKIGHFINMAAMLARCISATRAPQSAWTTTPGAMHRSNLGLDFGLTSSKSRRSMGFLSCGSYFVRRDTTSADSNDRPFRAAAVRGSNDQSVTRHRPDLQMTTSTLFTTSARTTLARPAGAARLNLIDFNPTVPVTGPNALTPVVIMHGLLGNSRNFQGWGANLVKNLDNERRVFSVDMRNHGASSHHQSMTYVDMADDVLGFLADQGLSEAVLIGHSMGGKAAAMAALLHPNAVKGVVVMDIAPVSYSMPSTAAYADSSCPGTTALFDRLVERVDATNWGETQKIIEAIHKMPLDGVNSRRDADELLANDIVDPALRAFAVTNLDKDPASGKWDWRINIDAIQRNMGVLAQFGSGKQHREEGSLGRLIGGRGDGVDELLPYKGDTMFIAGGNSRYVRTQHLGEIGKLFPSFMVSTVKGAGHWVHADNPTETLRLAKSFLDRPELG